MLYVLICVVKYSCVPTIYLTHFSVYIINQHNEDDSPQSLHIVVRINNVQKQIYLDLTTIYTLST
jgi:hypothetical protein